MIHPETAEFAVAALRGELVDVHLSVTAEQFDLLRWAADKEERTINAFIAAHALQHAHFLLALSTAMKERAEKGGAA